MNNKYFFLYFLFSFSTIAMNGYEWHHWGDLDDDFAFYDREENSFFATDTTYHAFNIPAQNTIPISPLQAQPQTASSVLSKISAEQTRHIFELAAVLESAIIANNPRLKSQIKTIYFHQGRQAKLLEILYNELLLQEELLSTTNNNSYNTATNTQPFQQQQFTHQFERPSASINNASYYLSHAINNSPSQHSHIQPPAFQAPEPFHYTASHTNDVTNQQFQQVQNTFLVDTQAATHNLYTEESTQPATKKRKRGETEPDSNFLPEGQYEYKRLVEMLKQDKLEGNIKPFNEVQTSNKWFNNKMNIGKVFKYDTEQLLPLFIVEFDAGEESRADGFRRHCNNIIIPICRVKLNEKWEYGSAIIAGQDENHLIVAPKEKLTRPFYFFSRQDPQLEQINAHAAVRKRQNSGAIYIALLQHLEREKLNGTISSFTLGDKKEKTGNRWFYNKMNEGKVFRFYTADGLSNFVIEFDASENDSAESCGKYCNLSLIPYFKLELPTNVNYGTAQGVYRADGKSYLFLLPKDENTTVPLFPTLSSQNKMGIKEHIASQSL